MVVWNQDWRKAQVDRLEKERKTEKDARLQWWSCERASWEDMQEEKEEQGRTRGSGKRKRGNWSQANSQGSTGARGSSDPPPPEPVSEPTATARPRAILDHPYPKRNHGDDMIALRAATMTPASFMPQRHITMALGRPVVVLSGI